jgi:hypothetical protein
MANKKSQHHHNQKREFFEIFGNVLGNGLGNS